jgi:hypothetical protein
MGRLIHDEINAAGELEDERRQEDGDQFELPQHVAPRQRAGEDGSCSCGRTEDADDSQRRQLAMRASCPPRALMYRATASIVARPREITGDP